MLLRGAAGARGRESTRSKTILVVSSHNRKQPGGLEGAQQRHHHEPLVCKS